MLRSTIRPQKPVEPNGIINRAKGSRLLPDLPTAILARLRGYIGGSYPSPLSGMAAEIGYYPLQSATPEEIELIQQEMESI
jgi:hypothetical protein